MEEAKESNDGLKELIDFLNNNISEFIATTENLAKEKDNKI